MKPSEYPAVVDPNAVGTYPALSGSGGGYVWDEVLEYRVWCHPERGAPDVADGSDYFHAFASYNEALEFSKRTPGSEEPLALILQREYIAEPEPGTYVHVREERMTEWPVNFLSRPKRTSSHDPGFSFTFDAESGHSAWNVEVGASAYRSRGSEFPNALPAQNTHLTGAAGSVLRY